MSGAIHVITTCTSRKLHSRAHGIEQTACLDLGERLVPARDLYTGEQHRRLMRGVMRLEAVREVKVWVISAKAGVIDGDERLSPYDESFAGMAPAELRALAERLDIPARIRLALAQRAALTLMLVGNDYFDAADLASPVEWGAPTLLLTSPSRADRLPAHPSLRVLPVGQALARRWSLPLTLLKGELGGRMLRAIAAGEVSPSELFGTVGEAFLDPDRHAVAC